MSFFRKAWNFIWHDDSFLSWIVNVILALVLVKFIIYPGLGLIFSTTHPLVAVVSGSMEHNNLAFDKWWTDSGSWYEQNNITKEEFSKFDFKNGFNKGDIMILFGDKKPKIGDVIVFRANNPNPIIHRIIGIGKNFSYLTKGDNNSGPDSGEASQIIGKAVLRIPYLGYIKIWFIEFVWNPITTMFK